MHLYVNDHHRVMKGEPRGIAEMKNIIFNISAILPPLASSDKRFLVSSEYPSEVKCLLLGTPKDARALEIVQLLSMGCTVNNSELKPRETAIYQSLFNLVWLGHPDSTKHTSRC